MTRRRQPRVAVERAAAERQLADQRDKRLDRRAVVSGALIGGLTAMVGPLGSPIVGYMLPPQPSPSHVQQLTPTEVEQCTTAWDHVIKWEDDHPDMDPVPIEGDPCNSIDVANQNRKHVNISIPPARPQVPPNAPPPPPDNPASCSYPRGGDK